MANTFELIAATTVGGAGAASIDFSSIPSTFTDLCLKLSARFANDDVNCIVRINGSSSSIYSGRTLTGTGSSASSSGYSGVNYTYALATSSTFTSNTFGNVELYLPNYTSSNNKSWSIDEVTENNATTSYARLGAYLYGNTSAVSSINIVGSAGYNFVQYSTAYLYGVKNA